MSWWTKTIIGTTLVIGGIAGAAYCVWQLMEIGTCASGGPYQVVRPCPPGTGLYIAGIVPAVISALVGCWVLATRGRRHPVAPGLPPEDGDVNTNPMPFGAYPPQGRPRH